MSVAEDVLLDKLEKQAQSLTNGHNGNMATLCHVFADLATVIVHIRKRQEDIYANGCGNRCAGMTWPAVGAIAISILGAVGTLFGILAFFAR